MIYFTDSLKILLFSTTTLLIPDRHCPCAVVPFWYFALEVCIFEWVVFCLDRESFDAGFCGRCFLYTTQSMLKRSVNCYFEK